MEKIQCSIPDVKKGTCLYRIRQTKKNNPTCLKCSYYQKLQELGFDPVKGFPPYDLNVFTRLPPPMENSKDLETRAYVTDLDLDLDTSLLLRARANKFEETRNPIYALEAFIIAYGAGLYPPLFVLEWLYNSFQAYHISNGNEKIDDLLGFTGRVFKKLIEEDRDECLMYNIWRLIKFEGYDIKRAAEMVSQQLKDNVGWNKTGLKIRSPRGSTLETRYVAEKWSQIFDRREVK